MHPNVPNVDNESELLNLLASSDPKVKKFVLLANNIKLDVQGGNRLSPASVKALLKAQKELSDGDIKYAMELGIRFGHESK